MQRAVLRLLHRALLLDTVASAKKRAARSASGVASVSMPPSFRYSLFVMHAQDERQTAVDLFNRTWTLMELPERTPEQDDEMIHAAHASRHHWAAVGTGANLARGEWQISRVYVTLGRAEPALYHAGRCLAYCEASQDDIADWDIPYRVRGARPRSPDGGKPGRGRSAVPRARASSAAQVADEQDREHLEEELATLP